MRYIFTLITLLFLVAGIHAQSGIRFSNYTINDGLSQSSVTCIVQDNLNSLWIGTQDGLNRYDGKTFESYTSGETEGLESEYIHCSAKDKSGNLWFGTSNGLTKYDHRKEEFVTFSDNKNASFQIQDIAIGKNGKIWIASTEKGLYSFDTKSKKFKSHQSAIPSIKTTSVYVLESGEIVVSTNDEGIFLSDDQLVRVRQLRIKEEGETIPTVNNIRVANKEETVLLATNQGVYELNTRTEKVKRILNKPSKKYSNINVTDVSYHPEMGWVLATNGSGLIISSENGNTYQYTEDIFQKNALLFNDLNMIFLDNSGVFWVGSQRGLSSFDPGYKGILGVGPSGNPEKGIPSPSVWSFAESQGGRYIYIGTDRAVSRLDKTTGKYTQFYRKAGITKLGAGEMDVLSIFIITKDRLLVGCADGLFELNINGTDYTYTEINIAGFEGTLKHKRAYNMVDWKDNQCFIGTKDGVLLFNYKTNTVVRAFEHDPSQPTKTITEGICRMVYKDRDDRIWFATSAGGLNILSELNDELTIRPYEWNTVIKSASRDYISSVHHDASGNYWLGTFGSGLVKWNEKSKKATVYNKKDGLPNDVIYGVVSDDKGKLWLSTNKGLCSFSIKSKKVKTYTEVDGLMSNEFNLGAFMKSRKGILYFGGIYGFNFFDPSELTSNYKDIRVIFTKFKLENEWLKPGQKGSPLEHPIYETKEVFLSYRRSSFTLKFQPSDLSNSDIINYKYVLEGSDEEEIYIGSKSLNEIHFNALAPGSYELKIYARMGDGNWSSVPASMKIYVSYPFWRTWWFWSIIVVVLAIAIRVFMRRRIDAARREQIRLEIKVRNRTKEIQLQNEKIEAQKLKIEEEKNKVLQQQKLLQIEKDKSEKLLKNVIPESTAEELKKRGRARARAYKTVSVLFTDFVGFTKISDRMTATELVKKLDVYFTKFDEIIVKNNLEKIKTIGDAYMCAGGVPVRNNTNPIDTCVAALQIQAYMDQRKHDAIANGEEFWELRLGINTGEVTAGVIGSERLAYDIWGATVNQAQRMEMLGEPGRVTITGATYQHIEPYFECTFKGKAQSKSRGLIDMYTVDRIKPELSENGEGLEPNQRFHEIVNLHHYSSINYYKAERHIMRLLEKHLSKKLYYHSIAHSKDVVKSVERIALLENVTDEGLFLLKSAANYHDAGFIEQYDNNEPIGARMAGEILPKYGYTDEHIQRIKELIYVTKIPHEPKNKLEEIICDADLDYLGRDDFHEISDRLRRELKGHGKLKSDRQWDEIQVSFLSSHKYFTETAINTRKQKKMENLQTVIDRLERDEYED